MLITTSWTNYIINEFKHYYVIIMAQFFSNPVLYVWFSKFTWKTRFLSQNLTSEFDEVIVLYVALTTTNASARLWQSKLQRKRLNNNNKWVTIQSNLHRGKAFREYGCFHTVKLTLTNLRNNNPWREQNCRVQKPT